MVNNNKGGGGEGVCGWIPIERRKYMPESSLSRMMKQILEISLGSFFGTIIEERETWLLHL